MLEAGGLKRLLERVKTNSFGESFSNYSHILENPEAKRIFHDLLDGKPLIDLGSGKPGSSVVILAHESGASKYVGVDKFKIYEEKKIPSKHSEFTEEYVPEDMLKYVFHLPDNSANVVINGINYEIINDGEYIKTLIGEIARIVPPNGVAMGFESPFLQNLREFGFKKIQSPDNDKGVFSVTIWQKPESKET